MTFRLACADFTFPLLSHEQSLDVISMLGFDGVDIGLFEGRSHLHPSREFAAPGGGCFPADGPRLSCLRRESP